MEYDLEINKIIELINKNNAKKVLLQLPDGLKPKAKEIVDNVCKEIKDLDVFIWSGTNFGACDIPVQTEKLGIDLILHFGHSEFVR
jgi:2-(3-amino-3-carboxypropyl)histidine synthase